MHQAGFALSGLAVDAARMRSDLDLDRGLIVAEAVMMALAPVVGRQVAHHIVYDVCNRAIACRTDLATQLRGSEHVVDRLGIDKIEELCDPARYLGSARAMTRAVIQR